ncbi:hypothetical protein [Cohnella sp. GbtcB17]|uniref:hypothetical protein n=1 Tax=Cohnella sp. GbtcB17 TaxID=2824762 RepID=UPI001C2FBBB2|nr:hypothetical protein [Cohnella sp. GbtcB17]
MIRRKYVPHFRNELNVVYRAMQVHIGLKLRLGSLGIFGRRTWPKPHRYWQIKEADSK